jgi:hypothetical protein
MNAMKASMERQKPKDLFGLFKLPYNYFIELKGLFLFNRAKKV